MGQEEGKQKEQISAEYNIVKTISPGEYWVRRKKKGDQLMLRILSFYVEEEMAAYVRILEKRKKIKNPHLLELIQHTRISEQNMCSSMFKIRTVVEYPFKTLKDQILERSLGNHKRHFNEDELWSILYSCCHALYSLYINKFYHECLNTQQIFIDTSGLVKIADSVLVSSVKNYLSLMNQGETEVAIRYISPELVNLVEDNNFYFYEKEKSDVFILAMIMLEVGNLTAIDYYNPNTKKFNFDAYMSAITQLRQKYSEQFCYILERMLVMDFKERPRLEEIIDNIEQRTIHTGSSGNTSFNSPFQGERSRESRRVPFGSELTEDRLKPMVEDRSINSNMVNPSSDHPIFSFHQSVPPQYPTQSIPPPQVIPSNPPRQITTVDHNISQNMFRFTSFPQVDQKQQQINRKEDFKVQKWSFDAIMKDLQTNKKPSNKIEQNYTPYQQLVGLTTGKVSSDKRNIQLVKRESSNPAQKPNVSVRFSTGLPSGHPVPSKSSEIHNNPIFPHLPQFQSTEFEGRRFSETKFGGIEILNNFSQMFQKQRDNPHRLEKNKSIEPSSPSKKPWEDNGYTLISQEKRSIESVARPIADSSPELPQSEVQPESQFVIDESPRGKYEGFVVGGKRNGVGRLVYPNGGYYQGKWEDGQMCGFGQLFYQNGSLAYKGFWDKGMFNGEGTVYNDAPDLSDKDRPVYYMDLDLVQDKCLSYQGMFLNDEKNGNGTMSFITGQSFTGAFVRDKADGEGEFHQMSREIVKGKWKNNKYVGMT